MCTYCGLLLLRLLQKAAAFAKGLPLCQWKPFPPLPLSVRRCPRGPNNSCCWRHRRRRRWEPQSAVDAPSAAVAVGEQRLLWSW